MIHVLKKLCFIVEFAYMSQTRIFIIKLNIFVILQKIGLSPES